LLVARLHKIAEVVWAAAYVDCNDKDTDGRARVTTDEERILEST